ncbi:triose-phosphate isomerase [Patescibacteria group bacterium]|nr:triose-phosphate isomerase [Patescibacteria group bacterium]
MPNPKLFLIANWKLHFSLKEATKWLDEFAKQQVLAEDVEVVICPSFPLLFPLFEMVERKKITIKLGAQNVSRFEEGTYTGEVGIRQLQEWVQYIIVGHSERRIHFKESDKEVVEKIRLCLAGNLTPIVCVSELEQVEYLAKAQLQTERLIVAYEPLCAISSGQLESPDLSESPEQADFFSQGIKALLGENVRVLYGGSVRSKNISGFLKCESLSGFLVGGASLDVNEFGKIVKIAGKV